MIYIDLKYVGLLSGRLERLKRKSGNIYNCRCPICGDSITDRTKTRGYIYEKKGTMLYFCHNCGASMSFGNFIKTIDPELFKQYTQEKFVEKYSNTEIKVDPILVTAPPKFIKDSPLKKLKKISQLDHRHPAKLYVDKRRIPPSTHFKLFYAPKFKEWVNSFVPDKFDINGVDEPRLIIPFLDADKNFFGLQGRSFSPNGLRYITIIVDENKPKIFGLDTVDLTRRIYVTEGPIDSLFLDNAVAMAGADVNASWFPDKSKLVFVYDNEPRNAEIIKRIEKTIDQGLKVCIWPEDIHEKDINDMILSGLSRSNIKTIIDSNTHEGLAAHLSLSKWKRI